MTRSAARACPTRRGFGGSLLPQLGAVVIPLVLSGVGASPAVAQRWQLDAAPTRVEFDTVSALNALSLAPYFEWQGRNFYTALSGSATAFEGSQWSGQGRADLSLLANPFHLLSPFRVELVGFAAATHHSTSFRTAATRGEVRFHASGRHVGGWVGGVAASGWTSGVDGIATGTGPTLGTWARYNTARAALLVTPMWLEGFWFPELSGRFSVTAGPLDLLAYGGWRDGAEGSGIDAATWGGGVVSLWLSDRLALTASGGSYAPDLLQGLPQGRFLSVGFRVATTRPKVLPVKPIGRPVYDAADGRLLRFEVPQARRVELVGDWTNWQPVPLRRAPDGSWVLPVDFGAGVYRFNLVVDGEQWIVPEGVASVDDGYGGRTGLLVISGDE